MTSKIGSKLDEYLEKQIILDFHFRGEQDVFEAEYGNLIDKAHNLLGEDLYDKLSACIGVRLIDKSPELYAVLFEKYQNVEKRTCERLEAHEIILKQFIKDD